MQLQTVSWAVSFLLYSLRIVRRRAIEAHTAENIVSQFSLDVQIAEARAFYSFQSMIEQVHSETYSLLIETYVRDQEEKDFLFKGMENSTYPFLILKEELCLFGTAESAAIGFRSGDLVSKLTLSPMYQEKGRLGFKVHNKRPRTSAVKALRWYCAHRRAKS